MNAAGQQVAGATVRIAGSGWSNQMLVDGGGHYGFGGLCAGSYTLQATLSGGQTTLSATTSVNGQNQVRLDLRVTSAGTTAPGVTGTPQPASTSEPNMPGTGFSGLLLAGGALLGILLLLSAGARRALGARRD